jgi:hypothetical protein
MTASRTVFFWRVVHILTEKQLVCPQHLLPPNTVFCILVTMSKSDGFLAAHEQPMSRLQRHVMARVLCSPVPHTALVLGLLIQLLPD